MRIYPDRGLKRIFQRRPNGSIFFFSASGPSMNHSGLTELPHVHRLALMCTNVPEGHHRMAGWGDETIIRFSKLKTFHQMTTRG